MNDHEPEHEPARPQGDPVVVGASGELTDVERAVPAFAALHWKYPGAMETRILDEFGWSSTRYFQVLNALLDRPQAHAYDPLLVSRLIRLRDTRQARRRRRGAGGDDAVGTPGA